VALKANSVWAILSAVKMPSWLSFFFQKGEETKSCNKTEAEKIADRMRLQDFSGANLKSSFSC
jgi:hypothetical protein